MSTNSDKIVFNHTKKEILPIHNLSILSEYQRYNDKNK